MIKTVYLILGRDNELRLTKRMSATAGEYAFRVNVTIPPRRLQAAEINLTLPDLPDPEVEITGMDDEPGVSGG